MFMYPIFIYMENNKKINREKCKQKKKKQAMG